MILGGLSIVLTRDEEPHYFWIVRVSVWPSPCRGLFILGVSSCLIVICL